MKQRVSSDEVESNDEKVSGVRFQEKRGECREE